MTKHPYYVTYCPGCLSHLSGFELLYEPSGTAQTLAKRADIKYIGIHYHDLQLQECHCNNPQQEELFYGNE